MLPCSSFHGFTPWALPRSSDRGVVSEHNTLLPSLLAESWPSYILPAHVQSVCFLRPGPVTASAAVPAARWWLSCAPAGSGTSHPRVLGSTGSNSWVKRSNKVCPALLRLGPAEHRARRSRVRRSGAQVLGWSQVTAGAGPAGRLLVAAAAGVGGSEPVSGVGARSVLCPVRLSQVLLPRTIFHRAA